MADAVTRRVIEIDAKIASGALANLKSMEVSVGSLEKSLTGGLDRIKQFGLALVAGFTIGAFVEGIKHAIDSMDVLNKTIQKVGISAEAFQKLAYAADLADVSSEALQKGLIKLSKNLQNVDTGSDDASKALRTLGVTGGDTAATALAKIADRFEQMPAGPLKAALAVNAFGKAGADLIPMLNEGSKGLKEMGDEAASMGLIMSERTLVSAEQFNDTLKKIELAGGAAFKQLATGLLPALNAVAEAFFGVVKEGTAFQSAGASIGEVVVAIAAQFIGFGAAVEMVGTAIGGLMFALNQPVQDTFKVFSQIGKDMDAIAAKAEKRIADMKSSFAKAKDEMNKPVVRALQQDGDAPAKLVDTGAILKAQLANTIAAQKQYAAESQMLLDNSYALGETSIQDYYDERTRIVREGLGNDIKAINAAISQQNEALKQSDDPAKSVAINAELVHLLGQRGLLQQTYNFESIKGSEDAGKATVALTDKITEQTAALAEQNGELQKAALLRFDIANRSTLAQFGKNKQTGAADDVIKLRELLAVNTQLNQVKNAQNLLLQDQATAEARIANELAASNNSPDAQLTALRQLNAVRQASLGPQRELNEQALEQARLLGGPAGAAAVAQQEAIKVQIEGQAAASKGAAAASAAFGIQLQKSSLLFGALSVQEAHIQNLETSGAVTSLQALKLTDDARQNSIATLSAQADALDAIGDKSPEAILKVAELRVQIEGLAASAHSAGKVFTDVFQSSFTDAFQGFIDGTKTASEAFRSFVTDVLKGIEQIIVKQTAEALFSSSSGASGGIGGILASLFTSGAGAGAGASAGNTIYAQGGVFGPQGLLPFASGGIVNRPTLFPFAGGAGLMGEAGPEAIMPLTRTGSGDLGVKMMGGQAPATNVYVINNADGTKATTKEEKRADGGTDVRVMVEAAVERGFATGRFDTTLSSNYGLSRKGRS